MKKWIAVLLAAVLACTACLAFAEEDPDALVDQGSAALQAKDYETAADWFHKAVELGETDEGQINYDKLIEEGKIPADYIPKDIIF